MKAFQKIKRWLSRSPKPEKIKKESRLLSPKRKNSEICPRIMHHAIVSVVGLEKADDIYDEYLSIERNLENILSE